mmetsp:Transcript_6365/g.39720  ORF Transcript_6365/g.39720 Transcript_6365/m.39720 type:complete len:217 (+) Transcript_6365:1352-2002(+)
MFRMPEFRPDKAFLPFSIPSINFFLTEPCIILAMRWERPCLARRSFISTFQEKTPRAPSTPATCSSLRPAPPPTCGWRTLCELWSINPGHFHQPRTGRTATRDGRRRRRWRRRGEAWTRQDARESATVLLASMWTMQVERRMGCLFGRERRAWRRTPRRNVAQRGRFDPGEEFNTSLASRDRAREKHWFSNRNDSTPIFLTQTHGRGRRKAISLTM